MTVAPSATNGQHHPHPGAADRGAGRMLDQGETPADLVAALVNPGVRDLPREVDAGELADQLRHHASEVARLRMAHADLLRRGLAAQARKALARMIDHERRRQQLDHAITRTTAPVPSLLDQVVDAIESSSGTGGRTRSHAHRSPIGLAAAALIGDIEATVGQVVGHGPRALLARRCWAWVTATREAPGTAATLADWVARARQVVEPSRPVDLAAPCPACGESVSWLPDDSGQVVRRAALQVDRGTGWARCTARPGGRPCGATWSPGVLVHLATVLESERVARLGEQPQASEGDTLVGAST